MKNIYSLFLFAVAALTPDKHALAQNVDVSEQLQHYQIEGRSARKLVEEMTLKGPPSAFGGPKYFARFEPNYSWHLYFERAGGQCVLDDFDISLYIIYTMPFWTDKEKAGKRLQNKWDAFIDALWAHEKGHGDIAVEEAVALGKLLNQLKAADTCDLLQDAASDALKTYLKASRRQKEYDRQTQHGKTQGAYFEY